MNEGLKRPVHRDIPRGIWVLGFVSMFMDISSEMVHALLPVYLVAVLGSSALAVGVIEGIAEATASIVKVFSGALSDRLGQRKLLTALGYGLAALTRPIFPLAQGLDWLVAARFVDRLGKGIRGAPRDALMADLAPPELRGASFGLRQSLDTLGAFLGPLIAVGLMWATQDAYQTVFWWAVLPATLALGLVVLGVREPERAQGLARVRMPLSRAELGQLERRYWLSVAVGAVFTLARFSEAFLLLRAHELGLSATWIPLVLVAMNLVYSIAAYPAGVYSDRVGRNRLLLMGLATLMAANLVLALLPGGAGLALGVTLWGLHLAFSQGTLVTLVADAAPERLRGTAFGVFNLVVGVASLGASVLAGALWEFQGSAASFGAGAGFAAVALLAWFCLHRRPRSG